MGAGKTYDIDVHKVKESWSSKKLTYNNRPAYEEVSGAKVSIQKKGSYACNVTDIVKAWQKWKSNEKEWLCLR